MNNIRRVLFALSFVTVTAATLLAQPGPDGTGRGPRRGPPGGPGLPPILHALDADKDGEVSAAEISGAAANLLTLDANKDGALSLDELRPAHPATAPTPPANAPTRGPRPQGDRVPSDRPRPVMPVMLALDANNDGTLSVAEIASAPRSLGALDANKDGKLTRDELRPLPPTSAN